MGTSATTSIEIGAKLLYTDLYTPGEELVGCPDCGPTKSKFCPDCGTKSCKYTSQEPTALAEALAEKSGKDVWDIWHSMWRVLGKEFDIGDEEDEEGEAYVKIYNSLYYLSSYDYQGSISFTPEDISNGISKTKEKLSKAGLGHLKVECFLRMGYS